MTKERRLAIKIWQEIVDMLEIRNIDVNEQKDYFCKVNDIRWENNCWFCQYVRKDYRNDLESRCDIDTCTNGCEKCPLYKEFASRSYVLDNFCGCSTDHDTLYSHIVDFNNPGRAKKLNAAKKILELLKGSKD